MLRPTEIGRNQLAREAWGTLGLEHTIIDARCGDLERPSAGNNPTDRSVAVADALPMSLVVHQILVPFQEQLDLDIQGLLEQLLRPASDHLIQRQQRETSVWTCIQ